MIGGAVVPRRVRGSHETSSWRERIRNLVSHPTRSIVAAHILADNINRSRPCRLFQERLPPTGFVATRNPRICGALPDPATQSSANSPYLRYRFAQKRDPPIQTSGTRSGSNRFPPAGESSRGAPEKTGERLALVQLTGTRECAEGIWMPPWTG